MLEYCTINFLLLYRNIIQQEIRVYLSQTGAGSSFTTTHRSQHCGSDTAVPFHRSSAFQGSRFSALDLYREGKATKETRHTARANAKRCWLGPCPPDHTSPHTQPRTTACSCTTRTTTSCGDLRLLLLTFWCTRNLTGKQLRTFYFCLLGGLGTIRNRKLQPCCSQRSHVPARWNRVGSYRTPRASSAPRRGYPPRDSIASCSSPCAFSKSQPA